MFYAATLQPESLFSFNFGNFLNENSFNMEKKDYLKTLEWHLWFLNKSFLWINGLKISGIFGFFKKDYILENTGSLFV